MQFIVERFDLTESSSTVIQYMQTVINYNKVKTRKIMSKKHYNMIVKIMS